KGIGAWRCGRQHGCDRKRIPTWTTWIIFSARQPGNKPIRPPANPGALPLERAAASWSWADFSASVAIGLPIRSVLLLEISGMPAGPATRQSLLLRLRDHQDHEAWAQFVDVYAPLIYDYARRRGLQDADAADLTQACLRRFAACVGSLEYDPQRGSFRGW